MVVFKGSNKEEIVGLQIMIYFEVPITRITFGPPVWHHGCLVLHIIFAGQFIGAFIHQYIRFSVLN